jgi:uncharacterized protein (DUF1778 family)
MYSFTMTTVSHDAKQGRLNMRLSLQNLSLIKAAAEICGQDVTSFVLGAALQKAREAKLQDTLIRVSRSEFDAILELQNSEQVVDPEVLLRWQRARAAETAKPAAGA